MPSFILPSGHTNEPVGYLENALLSRGLYTKKQLKKIYKSCNRADPPIYLQSEYQYYQYWIELAQICEDYDWEIYTGNPVDHGVNYVFFVFNVWCDVKPIEQYPYSSIYEYVAYMENAIVSLLYNTLDQIRAEFCGDIREYAGYLEKFALECDWRVANELEPHLWFHPMRRYNQIQFNDLNENIAFLEYHIMSRGLLSKKALQRKRKSNCNDIGYITTLQSILYNIL
jgi:hypothetical protein